ncbi:hypothetical protein AB0H23_27800 [Streptomyces albogriseolus]|uniref:hypothetical protein n=1 Tax=Streptomyces albogriseolus TaxID=1887 RepID=UPI0034614A14
MAPGYVRHRPDLARVTLEHHDEDPAQLVAVIELPLTHSALSPSIPYTWGDWETTGTRSPAMTAAPRYSPR